MRDFIKDSKKILSEESLAEVKNNKGFLRLSKQIIGDEFFTAERQMRSLYSLAKNGTDYDRERMQALIKKLQKIDKSAKLYKDRKDVPKNYQ